MGKLTFQQIKNAKPREKDYKLTDGDGLFVRIKPNGSKLWQIKYRYQGKENLYSVGAFPEVGIKEAREVLAEVKRQIREGINPNQKKSLDKLKAENSSANTFGLIAEEWFEVRLGDKSESHRQREYGLLKNHLYPRFENVPITEITPQILLSLLRAIEDTGSTSTAGRVRQTAGQVFRFAIHTSRAERDPTADLKGALRPHKVKHRAAIIDPEAFGKLLVAIDGYQGSPEVMTALRLMPMFFVRTNELRHMEWSEIDWNKGIWELPEGKLKMRNAHIVPLSKQSQKALRNLQNITGNRKYVFPNPRGASRPMSENGMLTALRTMGFTKEEMTVHGFRATARTLLDEELGFPVPIIEHQLAHAVRDATGRAYNRTQHLKERVEMMQAWSDYLDRLKRDAIGIRAVG